MGAAPVSCYFLTDKIFVHGYFPEYARIAAELGPSARICEVGVQTGESLRMWQSLFPMGQVTGVDHAEDATWPPETTRVISDQANPALGSLGPFDLVVDDASHDGDLTRRTFEILWPRVAAGGFYVVEDWFFGLEPWTATGGDPGMLEVVAGFLRMLDGKTALESVSYRYGMAVLRKKTAG